ncbi:uncharacterized protein LOC118277580 isoform X2 [Spodoptera frugiperda]|uniref:Uncharacterized protein LOC118277580 isoform X2 n=1 Tax=Spodoptera frugiperda TaxID=7108 RepID=A0A9R0DGQ2_SPOFR|nr:uncharacterized protein LOC118277580 isoform X2 [Spodoptera frugiperda]
MPLCAVLTCKSRSDCPSGSSSRLTFHPFPANEEIREKWIDMTGRDDWTPTANDYICSKHFRDTDYFIKRSGNRYLKTAAIPCEYVVYRDLPPIEDIPSTSRGVNREALARDEPLPQFSRNSSPDLSLPIQEADTTFSEDLDIDCNENDLAAWTAFQPESFFVRPTPSPLLDRRSSAEADSSSFEEKYRGRASSINPSPPISSPHTPLLGNRADSPVFDLRRHMQGLPSPRPSTPPSNMELKREIKKLMSRRKICKKALAVARSEVRKAKKIQKRLAAGKMTEMDKASAIIELQHKEIRILQIKERQARKIFKKINSLMKHAK